MEHKQGPGAGVPTTAEESAKRHERPADEDANYARLSDIQTWHETNETAAALRAVDRLSEQLLQANRKLELAVGETARLHRALTERNSAAKTAEQQAASLAAELLDREQALREARQDRADASVTVQALQSELAVLRSSTSWRATSSLRLAKTLVGRLIKR